MSETYINYKSYCGAWLKIRYVQQQTKSSKLVVIFPGMTYTCDMPLLYYAFLESYFNGYDVLALEYGFARTKTGFKDEELNEVVKETTKIIRQVNMEEYTQLLFISKSFGTLVAGEVEKKMPEASIKHLYLTPLKESIPYFNKTDCVVVTGSDDEYFNPHTTEVPSGIKIRVIEGGDHSFESENNDRNIEMLKNIIDVYKEFLHSSTL